MISPHEDPLFRSSIWNYFVYTQIYGHKGKEKEREREREAHVQERSLKMQTIIYRMDKKQGSIV